MGLKVHCGCLLLSGLLLSGACPGAFSQSRQSASTASGSHSLSRDEGLSILGAALERRRGTPSTDCSHLVHMVYERAGLPYSYLTSYQLYAGSSSFVRVIRPQPGDLIVWPGHVGVVVNPRDHTFYSAFSSGSGVEDYESKYWRNRGPRRFFRYLKSGVELEEGQRVARARSSNDDDRPRPNGATDPVSQAADAPVSPAATVRFVSAPDPVVRANRPSADEIQEAVLRSFRQNEEMLRGQDVFKLEQKLVFFDQMRVRKVHFKREQAWAELQIDAPVSVAAARIDEKRHSERLRCALTRNESGGWQVQLPPAAIYVPYEVAPQILAHQLAALTDGSSDADRAVEQSQLAHALDVLLH
jgi:hypothetical protein